MRLSGSTGQPWSCAQNRGRCRPTSCTSCGRRASWFLPSVASAREPGGGVQGVELRLLKMLVMPMFRTCPSHPFTQRSRCPACFLSSPRIPSGWPGLTSAGLGLLQGSALPTGWAPGPAVALGLPEVLSPGLGHLSMESQTPPEPRGGCGLVPVHSSSTVVLGTRAQGLCRFKDKRGSVASLRSCSLVCSCGET